MREILRMLVLSYSYFFEVIAGITFCPVFQITFAHSVNHFWNVGLANACAALVVTAGLFNNAFHPVASNNQAIAPSHPH